MKLFYLIHFMSCPSYFSSYPAMKPSCHFMSYRDHFQSSSSMMYPICVQIRVKMSVCNLIKRIVKQKKTVLSNQNPEVVKWTRLTGML